MSFDSAIPAEGDFYRWHGLCKQLSIVPRRSPAAANDAFDFFAVTRNPPRPGLDRLGLREGVHGIRESKLLRDYAETLRRAWHFFANVQHRSFPAERLAVYVFAVNDSEFDCGSPCFDELLFVKPNNTPDRIVPIIALPSRSQEPDASVATAQNLSSAVHELSHYFNSRFLPYRRIPLAGGLDSVPKAWAGSWLWLDEGMAVASEADFAESEAAKVDGLPMGRDWVRFALDWVDRPERSLDDPNALYQAAFFVRYVNRLIKGPGFLNQVWQRSQTVWDPVAANRETALAALARAFAGLPERRPFCSATEEDIFASGYCFDSYFLNDPKSRAYEPMVFARFRERAITRTWRWDSLPINGAGPFRLPGLACRYFRFLPDTQSKRLTVKLRPSSGSSLASIKAELALAAPGPDHYVLDSRRTAERINESGTEALVCSQNDCSSQTCSSIVLVVTNCAIGSNGQVDTVPSGHSQRAEFNVEATYS